MAGWCASLTKPEKGIWVIVVLAAIAVLIFEWVLVVCDFVTYPYRSHVIYDEEDHLELPTILICSRDPINQTIASRAIYSASTIRYYQQLNYPAPLGPGFYNPLQQYEVETARKELDSFYNQYSNNKWNAHVDLHFQCQGMVTRCQLGDGPNMTGYDCCKASTPVMTPVGPCISMALPDQYNPSYLGGYQIDFELRTTDMQGAGVTFPGIDIYIGDSVEKPMYPVLRIQRDQKYLVKLNAKSYYKSNRRKCDNYMTTTYRSDMPFIMATLNCTAKIINNKCQCYPFYTLQLGDRYQNMICQWDKLQCENDTLRLMRDKRNVTDIYNSDSQYSDLCGTIKPPCHWQKYDSSVNIERDTSPSTGNYAAKLHLFYEDFEVLMIEQYFAPNFHDVIIQMGGALVFWFVVVHILMYIVEGLKLCTHGVKQQNKIEDAEMMTAMSRHHQPPVVTHIIEQTPPPPFPGRQLAPLPPIPPVNESNQETQTNHHA